MKLEKYDDKLVSFKDSEGYTIEGIPIHYCHEYCFHEYGVDEDCLEILSYVFYESQIEDIKIIDKYSSDHSHLEELVSELDYDEIIDVLENEKSDYDSYKRLIDYLKSINRFNKEEIDNLYKKI